MDTRKKDSDPKRAIVLAGGGSRGAYQVGVWRGLRELELDYHIVVGTSVGSLNGALMATDRYEEAIRLWEGISNDLIIKKPNHDEDGAKTGLGHLQQLMKEFVKVGMDVTPLEDMVKATVDEEEIRRSPIQYGMITVRLPSFKQVKLLKDQIPQGELADYLLASSACFPAFHPKTIGEQKFIDGAYSDNLPISLALEAGATEIIAVDLGAIGIVRAVPETDVPITYIHCYWPLGNTLLFDPDIARQNMELGYLDCMKTFDKLDGWAYAFEKGCLDQDFDALAADNLLTRYVPLSQESSKPSRARHRTKLLSEGRLEREEIDSKERFLLAGELAGELLGLSHIQTYNRDRWHDELKNALATANEALNRLGNFRLLATSPSELANTLQEEGLRLAFACHQLEAALEKGDQNAMRLIEVAMPKEFIAGLYLIQMELNKE